MKEKPIIFSSEGVCAILEGHKTQTRRVIKPQPPSWVKDLIWLPATKKWRARHRSTVGMPSPTAPEFVCPYGQPGDLLWVRETFHIDKPPAQFPEAPPVVHYRASQDIISQSWNGKWSPSIFMPRWVSRITLRVLDVRVQQVQDISYHDARAEGCPPSGLHDIYRVKTEQRGDTQTQGRIGPTAWFAHLWNSLNAKRGFPWSSNPWVWVIEFITVS